MFSIVVTLATANDPQTEHDLERAGYRRCEVWIKDISKAQEPEERSRCVRLGVAQFLQSDYWGRGVD